MDKRERLEQRQIYYLGGCCKDCMELDISYLQVFDDNSGKRIVLCKACVKKRHLSGLKSRKRSVEQIALLKAGQRTRRERESKKRQEMWADGKMDEYLGSS